MSKGLLPAETIKAAISGDELAQLEVKKFYEAYISQCSKRISYDEFGNQYPYVDQEMKASIESKLLEKITVFEIYKNN